MDRVSAIIYCFVFSHLSTAVQSRPCCFTSCSSLLREKKQLQHPHLSLPRPRIRANHNIRLKDENQSEVLTHEWRALARWGGVVGRWVTQQGENSTSSTIRGPLPRLPTPTFDAGKCAGGRGEGEGRRAETVDFFLKDSICSHGAQEESFPASPTDCLFESQFNGTMSCAPSSPPGLRQPQ